MGVAQALAGAILLRHKLAFVVDLICGRVDFDRSIHRRQELPPHGKTATLWPLKDGSGASAEFCIVFVLHAVYMICQGRVVTLGLCAV